MPMSDLQSIMTNNVSAIVMAALFIWFQVKINQEHHSAIDDFNRTIREFNSTIRGYLKDDSKSRNEMASKLQDLTDIIQRMYRRLAEFREREEEWEREKAAVYRKSPKEGKTRGKQKEEHSDNK